MEEIASLNLEPMGKLAAEKALLDQLSDDRFSDLMIDPNLNHLTNLEYFDPLNNAQSRADQAIEMARQNTITADTPSV